MKANCWKCGNGFRFDEAKVKQRALVRCPICKAKILLQQDPNDPEPKFFVSAFEEKSSTSKAEFEVDYSKQPKENKNWKKSDSEKSERSIRIEQNGSNTQFQRNGEKSSIIEPKSSAKKAPPMPTMDELSGKDGEPSEDFVYKGKTTLEMQARKPKMESDENVEEGEGFDYKGANTLFMEAGKERPSGSNAPVKLPPKPEMSDIAATKMKAEDGEKAKIAEKKNSGDSDNPSASHMTGPPLPGKPNNRPGDAMIREDRTAMSDSASTNPNAYAPQPARTTKIHAVAPDGNYHIPPPRNNKRKINIFLAVSVLVVLFMLVTYVFPEMYSSYKSSEEQIVNEVEVHPGLEYIRQMARDIGRNTEQPLQLTKEAELSFMEDSHAGYVAAMDSFKRAMVQNEDNAELISRYVESYILSNSSMADIVSLKHLRDLIDYGFTVSPGLASLHRANARIFMGVDKLEKASKEAEKALKLEPTNLENTIVLAKTLIRDYPSRAIDLLTPIMRESKFPRSAVLPLANAYLRIGNFAMAEDSLRMRDLIDIKSCALCNNLGQLYESIGLYDRALEVYKRLWENRPESASGIVGMARSKWASGVKYSKIRKMLNEIPDSSLGRFSTDDKVLLLAAKSHFAILDNDYISSMSFAEQAMKINPTSTLARYHYVAALSKTGVNNAGNWQKLKGILESLVLDIPHQPELYALWGTVAMRYGDLETALSQYQMTIRTNSRYLHGHLLLGRLYMMAGNTKLGFDAIERTLRYSPDFWTNHPDRNFYTDVFEYEKNLVHRLKKADESKVDRDKKHLLLGVVAYLIDNEALARKHLDLVLRNDKNNVPANIYLSFLMLKNKQTTQSRVAISKVLRADRKNQIAHGLFGRILEMQGQREEAMQHIQRIIDGKTKNASNMALLSLMAHRNGQSEQARRLAKRAYSVDPSSLLVRQARYYARI